MGQGWCAAPPMRDALGGALVDGRTPHPPHTQSSCHMPEDGGGWWEMVEPADDVSTSVNRWVIARTP